MYDQLRTKDQVGYDVHCHAVWSFGIIGCVFHITTNVMSMEEFGDNRMGVAFQKLEMSSSLSDEADFLLDEIRNRKQLAMMRPISKR